ncbi:MAG: D-tyrosyl-tRNA(Tyr) deacylase [Candidatus Omnitrophica bacterium]|nr:D-tyrosyl-tRNA(Tyr) deacylase [Candidatus Omnitrophota bacterium]MBD3268554.1 D-tyrosyl-tRNA(Tyr) deacylase [Candidatus Omnitrophota bacterium]
MRVIISRIVKGKIKVNRDIISSVGEGLVVFAGFQKADREEVLKKMVDKIINLRIFQDSKSKFNYSLKDKKGAVLCVPNFTLSAVTAKGRRPSFEDSLPFDSAKNMFTEFVELFRKERFEVKKGVFGERMDIELEMEGPVNIILDSRDLK